MFSHRISEALREIYLDEIPPGQAVLPREHLKNPAGVDMDHRPAQTGSQGHELGRLVQNLTDCVKTRLGTASGQHWCAAAVRLQHGIERRMMRCRHAESASLPHHMAREAFYFERTSSGEIVVHRGVHASREAF